MPFLPGDSLLFAAGAFLGLAGIDPLTSIAIITAAAIIGDALNYTIGSSRWGQKLAHSRWIKPAHMERAREYFARFGAMTITVARFVPIVRTLAPFVAGLSQMPRGRFYAYNVVGGVVWCSSMMLAGYWLGSIPGSGQPALGLGHHHRPVADPRRAAMAAGATPGAAALTPGAGLARPGAAASGGASPA